MAKNSAEYADRRSFDRDGVNGTVKPGNWRGEFQMGDFEDTIPRTAKATKARITANIKEFEQYFMGRGELEYQYDKLL